MHLKPSCCSLFRADRSRETSFMPFFKVTPVPKTLPIWFSKSLGGEGDKALGGVGTERSGHPDACAVVTLRSVIVKRAAWISTLHRVTVTRNLVKNRPPQPLARS